MVVMARSSGFTVTTAGVAGRRTGARPRGGPGRHWTSHDLQGQAPVLHLSGHRPVEVVAQAPTVADRSGSTVSADATLSMPSISPRARSGPAWRRRPRAGSAKSAAGQPSRPRDVVTHPPWSPQATARCAASTRGRGRLLGSRRRSGGRPCPWPPPLRQAGDPAGHHLVGAQAGAWWLRARTGSPGDDPVGGHVLDRLASHLADESSPGGADHEVEPGPASERHARTERVNQSASWPRPPAARPLGRGQVDHRGWRTPPSVVEHHLGPVAEGVLVGHRAGAGRLASRRGPPRV